MIPAGSGPGNPGEPRRDPGHRPRGPHRAAEPPDPTTYLRRECEAVTNKRFPPDAEIGGVS